MKAHLREKETGTLKFWAENDIYQAMLDSRDGSPRYVLHDGPALCPTATCTWAMPSTRS